MLYFFAILNMTCSCCPQAVLLLLFDVSFRRDYPQFFDFTKHCFGSLNQIESKALADFEKALVFSPVAQVVAVSQDTPDFRACTYGVLKTLKNDIAIFRAISMPAKSG